MRRSVYLLERRRITQRHDMIELDSRESADIDTLEDFIAESLLK